MDLKKKLLDMAIDATGDKTVTVAGDFEPKGLAWKRAAGATAGAFIGSEIGDGWTGIGAVGGAHPCQKGGTSGGSLFSRGSLSLP